MPFQEGNVPEINAPKIFVVITDFNGYDQTKQCLGALSSSSFRNFQVVVVDHGTTPETQNGLATEFPACTRLSASPELWWAGAVNVGVRYALLQGAAAVVLLNNDCYVESTTLEVIVSEWLGRPDSIIAPIQKDSRSGNITSIALESCLLFGFPTRPGSLRMSDDMKAQHLLPANLIGGGRGVIIPARVFKIVGQFDESDLPHYWADHDFYFRAKSEGVKLYVSTLAFVTIDSTRTTVANDVSKLSLKEFVRTLVSMRSHRSVAQVSALFRKHYPVSHAYMFGVFLYTARYIGVYAVMRTFHLLKEVLMKLRRAHD